MFPKREKVKMSQNEFVGFEERLQRGEAEIEAIFRLLKRHCPIQSELKNIENLKVKNVVDRYKNYFKLHTLRLDVQDSIHATKIRNLYTDKIPENVLKYICKDEKFINLILDLSTHNINAAAVINGLTSNLTDLPPSIRGKKPIILETFRQYYKIERKEDREINEFLGYYYDLVKN